MKLHIWDEGTMEWIGKDQRFWIGFDNDLPYWGFVNRSGVMESDYFTQEQLEYLKKKIEESL